MIRSHTKADVCYTTPCGRRLRAYQEVTRYLELNAIQDLTVDNFSFSTKILVGQFLEAQGVGGVDPGYISQGGGGGGDPDTYCAVHIHAYVHTYKCLLVQEVPSLPLPSPLSSRTVAAGGC